MFVEQCGVVLLKFFVDGCQQGLSYPSPFVGDFILAEVVVDDAHLFIAHQTGETCVSGRIFLRPCCVGGWCGVFHIQRLFSTKVMFFVDKFKGNFESITPII